MPGTCRDSTLRCCNRSFDGDSNVDTVDDSEGDSETEKETEKSDPIPVEDLPIIAEMPAPLTMNDGTQVTTPEQWTARRQEMIKIMEDYEYGHMPPPPENVTADVVTPESRVTAGPGVQADYRMLHLTFGPGEQLGFDLGLFTPIEPPDGDGAGYPVLITLAFSAGENSLAAASAAMSRGFAVATVPYQQLGADAPNWVSTGFFPAYPEYDWRDFSAWAWGISRAVDYLVTDALVDREKIAITGASRLGQGITEIVDQNTYWFGPRFEEFRNQTERLPCDQHWLPALTAPRLFIMYNSLEDEYGRAYAAVQTYLSAKPVYEFLGADENLGVHFRPGGHGMTSEDWSAILDFADQYLLNRGGTRRFDVLPPPR
jgi:hypothetical protein